MKRFIVSAIIVCVIFAMIPILTASANTQHQKVEIQSITQDNCPHACLHVFCCDIDGCISCGCPNDGTWQVEHNFADGYCLWCGCSEENPTQDNSFHWTFNESSGELSIHGKGDMPDYEYEYFYDMVGKYEYVSTPWFEYRYDIKSVTISQGITSIGNYAFFDCANLKSIYIPDSVRHIGECAFELCSDQMSIYIDDLLAWVTISFDSHPAAKKIYINNVLATDIIIPDGITHISDGAFWNCCSLTSVTIPGSVTTIGDNAFCGCLNLSNVTIADGVTEIGDWAFYYCEKLTKVTIPTSLTSIGVRTFSDCKSLTDITIPDSVTSIGVSAFSNCSSLTSVTIPDSVTIIGAEAFYRCAALTSVTLSDSVAMIDTSTFYNCDSLTSITIPDSVKSIGKSAFYGCENLTSVAIPDSVKSIGESAFLNCSSLKNMWIPDGVTEIGETAFYNCNSLTSVAIPDSVKSIGPSAFYGCESLKSVTISDSVKSIGKSAFANCCNLTGIWVDDANLSYSSDDQGVLFNKEKTTLLQCPGGYFGDYIIPDSVTIISDYAFYGCIALRNVTIPNGVTYINNFTFYDCCSLTSVTIPNSVTGINRCAFSNCSSLTSVKIPDSVTYIGNSTFSNCSSLTSVTIPNSVTYISKYAFSNCSSLKSITIPNSVTSIGYYAFRDCISLTSVTIPKSMTSIDQNTFSGCSSLSSIVIPDSVTSIGWRAFDGCANLTDVYYSGTEDAWNAISIDSYNTALTSATIHYNHLFDESLNPSMNISAGAEMSVSYSITASEVSEFEDFYLLVEKEMADGEIVSTAYGVVDERTTRNSEERQPLKILSNPETGEPAMYIASYEGINAKEMGDSFTTTLYGVDAEGKIHYRTIETSSMKEYLLSRLNGQTASPELKTMVVDMLKYGAAAQIRLGYNTENLVTADLTEEQLSYATQGIPEAANNAASAGTGAAVNTNITVGAKVQLNLSCIYTTATDPNAVKCVITDSEGKILAEIAATNKGNIMFSAIYENVGAKEMRDVINATFYEGETAISQTVSWSVESYVAQVRAKTTATEDEIAMVNAMLTYGDSVAAYMEAK